MADNTLSKIVELLSEPDAPELRRAAALVAGSVGTAKDKNLVKSLLANLGESDLDLRIAAVESLGRLRADDALDALIGLVRQGGPELEAAVHAAGQLGVRGMRAMGKIMEEAAPSLRSRIAAVLAKSGTGGGLVVTAHALLDPDPKVVDAAARSLALEVPEFGTSQKHALAKFLGESVAAKKGLAAKTLAAMLRLLGTLQEPGTEEFFWECLGPGEAPEVRAAALQALSHHATPTTDARIQRLLGCAADNDFQIVAHALMILKHVPPSAKNTKHWLKLLQAHDVATRRFAVERLQGIETAEVARGLVEQLAHADRGVRDEARQALLRFAKGRQALLEQLLEAETVDASWDLARALASEAKDLPTATKKSVLERAVYHHERDDRRAASLWFLLRAMDAAWTHDQIEARASGLRGKKKYAEAVGYYRLLAQDPACSEDVRFELAAAGLKVSNHDPAAPERLKDPALGQLGRLLQNPEFDVLGRLRKTKWLDAEDLFYVGFHFAEQTHRARDLGKAVLELVAERSPKSEPGKNARKKLKLV